MQHWPNTEGDTYETQYEPKLPVRRKRSGWDPAQIFKMCSTSSMHSNQDTTSGPTEAMQITEVCSSGEASILGRSC